MLKSIKWAIVGLIAIAAVFTFSLCQKMKAKNQDCDKLEATKLDELREALFLSDSFKLAAQGKLESYEVIIQDLEKNPKIVYKTVYKDTGSTKIVVSNPETLIIYTDTSTGPRVTLPFTYPLHTLSFIGSIEGREDSTMAVKIDSLPNRVEITRTVQRDPKNRNMTNTLVTIKNTNPILSNNNTKVDSIQFTKLNDDGLKMIEEAGKAAGVKEGKKKGFWNGVAASLVTVAAITAGSIFLLLR